MQNKLWTFDELVNDAWDNLLQCTPYADVLKVAFNAKTAKEALEKVVGEAVRAYATQHFTGAALAALSGPPREAAKAWILPRTAWVTAPADLDTLTDHVLGATKVAYKDKKDPVWTDMRAKITDFVVCAEVDIIKDQIDTYWSGKTTEEVWARARGMYVGTMEKPVWKFYSEDIMAFSLFGHSTGKVNGVHKNVVPELARVEASAKRLAGPAWATTTLPQGFGFRFQPQDGDFAKNAHVSLHATGRAIDFDAVHNPFTSGTAKSLAGALGGVDFDAPGGMPGFGELRKLAEDIAAKHAAKAALEAKLKEELSEEEKGKAEQQLADIEAQIAALPNRADVVSIRDRAGRAHDDLVTAQTEFLKVWQELTGGGKAKDIDVAKVLERLAPVRAKAAAELVPVDEKIKKLTEDIEKLKTDSGDLKKQGKAADPAAVADVKARLAKAQADLDPLRAEKKRLEERIKQLTDLEKRFGGMGEAGRKILNELEKTVVSGGGLTNMPKWMVQGFAENGFSWGGGWHDPEDAMHFSSMTPIPGLIQPGG
jgi:hypothetical protein